MAPILETALNVPSWNSLSMRVCALAQSLSVHSLSHSVVSSALRPHGLYPPPGSSVHESLQAGMLGWIAISSYFYVNW